MAFRFLQWLSAFSNGFLIFSNGFPIFLNGFPLSKKTEKIYLWWEVYERSPFELCISRHSLPELCNCHSLPKLCNCHSLPELRNCHSLPELRNCYNAYISPNSKLNQYCHFFEKPFAYHYWERYFGNINNIIITRTLINNSSIPKNWSKVRAIIT